jgi:hypothetical protein
VQVLKTLLHRQIWQSLGESVSQELSNFDIGSICVRNPIWCFLFRVCA